MIFRDYFGLENAMQLGNLVMFHDVVGVENTGRWGLKLSASGKGKTKNIAAGRRCVLRCRLDQMKNKRIQKTRGRDTGQFKHIYTPREPNAEVVLPCEARLGDSILFFAFSLFQGTQVKHAAPVTHAMSQPPVQLRKADQLNYALSISFRGPPWHKPRPKSASCLVRHTLGAVSKSSLTPDICCRRALAVSPNAKWTISHRQCNLPTKLLLPTRSTLRFGSSLAFFSFLAASFPRQSSSRRARHPRSV